MSISQLSMAAVQSDEQDLHEAAENVEMRKADPLNEATQGHLKPNVELPNYDRSKLKTGIAHFGIGGFSRSHQLWYTDSLMRASPEEGASWAYTGIGVLPHDAGMRDALEEQDYLYSVVSQSKSARDEDVKERVRVVGCMKDMLLAPEHPGQVMKLLATQSTKIYSLTITEFGYTVPTSAGDNCLLELAHRAAEDPWEEADSNPAEYLGATALGYIVAGLAARRASMSGGATILSCDNIPGNGDNAKDKIFARAKEHSLELKEWIKSNCTFPNCMVDRITPITSMELHQTLGEKYHLKDNWPVNCETFAQWVVEDKFVNGISGRPKWEEVGVQLVDNVHPYELTKIRCLNVIHTAMVFPALLMGLEYIHEAATHPLVKKYFTTVMTKEMRPPLENVEGIENIDLDSYSEVLVERFSNETIADTLLRVAMDTSDKISVQGVPAILDGFSAGCNMKGMAFCVASWAHFVLQSMEAGAVLRDQKARIVEAALEHKNIASLLDVGLIFHELIYHEEWKDMVTHYYDSIAIYGVQGALATMLNSYDGAFGDPAKNASNDEECDMPFAGTDTDLATSHSMTTAAEQICQLGAFTVQGMEASKRVAGLV